MKINLDINRSEPILETINLRQGDGGLRTIDIQITENNQPIAITGYTLQFEANLPSGSMVQHAGVIKDATAGLFSYTFTSSDTSEAGQLPVAYFRLYDANNNSVATRNIRIVVDRAADITQPQANDYLAKVNQLIADSEAKLESNNQQIAAQQTQLDAIKANGINIGGRNLAQKTSSEYNTAITGFVGQKNYKLPLARVLTDGLLVGDTVTMRLVIQYENLTESTVGGGIVIIQGPGNATGWNTGFLYGFPGHRLTGSGVYEYTSSFKITADHVKNNHWDVEIRFDNYGGGSVRWKQFSAVRGINNIDWTPAPEDYLARVAALEQAILNK